MRSFICLAGTSLLLASMVLAGCVHYPVNQPIEKYLPGAGYRIAHLF